MFIFFQKSVRFVIFGRHRLSIKTLLKKKKKKNRMLVYFDAMGSLDSGFKYALLCLSRTCFFSVFIFYYIFFTCIILKLLFFSPVCNSYPDSYFFSTVHGVGIGEGVLFICTCNYIYVLQPCEGSTGSFSMTGMVS